MIQMTAAMAQDHAAQGIQVVAIWSGDKNTAVLDDALPIEVRELMLKELSTAIPIRRVAESTISATQMVKVCSEYLARRFSAGLTPPAVMSNNSRVDQPLYRLRQALRLSSTAALQKKACHCGQARSAQGNGSGGSC